MKKKERIRELERLVGGLLVDAAEYRHHAAQCRDLHDMDLDAMIGLRDRVERLEKMNHTATYNEVYEHGAREEREAIAQWLNDTAHHYLALLVRQGEHHGEEA